MSLAAPFIILLGILLPGGCSRSTPHEQTYTQVRALLDTMPERALAILDSIPSGQLQPGLDSARFILLHALAEDKCYALTTSDSTMNVAIKVFKEKRLSNELMNALYINSRILYNKDLYSDAFVSLIIAEELFIPETPFFERGLIYQQLAECCNITMNGNEAIGYAQKASDAYSIAKKPLHAAYSQLMMGIVYNNHGKYEDAIPIFKSLIDSASVWDNNDLLYEGADGIARSYYGKGEYDNALRYFRLLHRNNAFPDDKSTSLWIASEAKCGNKIFADSMANRMIEEGNIWVVESLNIDSINNRNIITAYSQIIDSSNNLLYNAYSNTLASTIKENSKIQKQLLEEQLLKHRIIIICIILISILIIIGCLIIRRYYRKQLYLEQEKNTQEIQDLKDTLDKWKNDYQLFMQSSNKPGINSQSAINMDSFTQQYVEIVNILATAWDTISMSTKTDKIILKKLTELSDKFHNEPKYINEIENIINFKHDNVVKHLIEEVPQLRDQEKLLFILITFGFSSSWITRIMKLPSINDYYTRKSRLKSKLITLSPPSINSFLSFF